MGLLDHFDGLVSIFDDWFNQGWLWLAIPISIALMLWVFMKLI